MNNKKIGTAFEREVCKRVAETGAWVHFLSPDEKGSQPFDIIAVRDGIACAIECKTLNSKATKFPISRLEENQILAMEKWISCGNADPLIAVYWRGNIHVIEYSRLKREKSVDLFKWRGLDVKKGKD